MYLFFDRMIQIYDVISLFVNPYISCDCIKTIQFFLKLDKFIVKMIKLNQLTEYV